MSPFKRLFQPGKIGRLAIANRIIMAPMVTHLSMNGAVTDKLIAYYAERAIGGTGLIILEASHPRTGGVPGRVHIWKDSFIPGLRKLTDEIHRCGAKMAIEINPSLGRSAPTDPISASNVPHPVTGIVPRALTVSEIKKVERDFGRGAIRAREAGFDAIMIHGGSGYLISEFLSPRTNLRKDSYGGDIEGRSRLAVEMLREAKKNAGKEFPVIFRLAASERLEGGISPEDIAETCRLIVEAGADAIDVVSGVADTTEWVIPSWYFPHACNVSLAEEIKRRVPIPVTVAGRINDPSVAEEILEQGKADFIVMGRALLADPHFPIKAKEGRVGEIRKCLACLRCQDSFSAAAPLTCTVNPTLGKERDPDLKQGKAKKVLIIGGGPAGLQAAVTAAERGHNVFLMEKAPKLGGQVNLACIPPDKSELKHILNYLLNQLKAKRSRIKVIYDEATPACLKKLKPDTIIAAAGSRPLIPSVFGIKPGMKQRRVVTGRDVLSAKINLGRKVVIIGGGIIGCEIADTLVDKGHKVVILEILHELAGDASPLIRKVLLKRLEQKGVRSFTNVREERILKGGVEILVPGGEKMLVEADKIILSTGSAANTSLFPFLQKMAPEFYAIGDCKEPRKILEAIHEGYTVARNL